MYRIYLKNINFLNSSANNKVSDIWIPRNANRNIVQEFEWDETFRAASTTCVHVLQLDWKVQKSILHCSRILDIRKYLFCCSVITKVSKAIKVVYQTHSYNAQENLNNFFYIKIFIIFAIHIIEFYNIQMLW